MTTGNHIYNEDPHNVGSCKDCGGSKDAQLHRKQGGMTPEGLAGLNDIAVEVNLEYKFGLYRGQRSEREIAEAMMRIPNEALDRRIAKLQKRIDWLQGWKK